MHEVVAEKLDQETNDVHHWQKKWEAAFVRSFERVDNEIFIEAPSLEMVGSAAVVAILCGCQIIASNCGTDPLPSHLISLTRFKDKHFLFFTREDELLRIEEQGGKIINWNGARVFGVLAMSRAIGDRYLRPWIIPVPEITFTTRSDEDECLILASDGLWDVMSNDEVARRILRRRRRSMSDDETPAAQTVADSLTEISLGRNSTDNISIIVVDLKAKRKRRQNP
ncbi:probable protein phosphatase 2C 6 [Lycium barbarum]|uniref:probable protein phosphatase 2C 6 n=1 Tax=Lycium barbarum TaxID=112863 RepID=UPI00293E8AAE|nr:probable protein phosphatase 2C 6 [Lycium barbarum]